MRLTIYTDYSLRLLMYLALNEGGLVTIADVAGAYGIPKNHLAKVAHQLGLAGDIQTVRGKGGGLRLARPAGDIRVGEVVRRTEPDFALVECFETASAQCCIVPACGLVEVLQQARDAFLAVLDRYTLADLVGQCAALRGLLGIPDGAAGARPEFKKPRARLAAPSS